jgi:beta-ribofuranosylaminobenzene 5'-phosphate synthase
MTDAIFIEAPARLHFGVLDLRGALGRRFGGIGAAAPEPTLLLSASRADTLTVTGEDADRASGFARQFLAHHGLAGGAMLHVERALPPHAGLGSGTQLALAVARALAEIYGLSTDAPELARAVRRAQRSAIGTWTFAGGGLVLEGGYYPGSGRVAPLLARLPFPPSWRCIVAVPHATPGMSGAAEAQAFADLPPPPERDVERVAHLVLMGLLPALVDADLARFGPALSEIQAITGQWFAPAQGGTFTPGPTAELVRRMTNWGAVGVGQSSWGPTVYGMVEGEQTGAGLAEKVRTALGSTGAVYEGPFRAEGARVWRGRALSDVDGRAAAR